MLRIRFVILDTEKRRKYTADFEADKLHFYTVRNMVSKVWKNFKADSPEKVAKDQSQVICVPTHPSDLRQNPTI